MYMFHIELVIKMEALYSKLYDKYTKLKLSRGSRSHTLCNCSIKTDNYVAFKVLLIFICAKIWIWVCLIYRARLQSKEVLCETQYWNCDAQVFLYNASSKGGTAGYAMQGQVLALKRGGESWSCCKRYNRRNDHNKANIYAFNNHHDNHNRVGLNFYTSPL
ncbi:uncharacterized protein LOC112034705 isoform X2 [Quercus suber]|uniref:uncharacterized protein LOC112034705 isoform X2 n=1 Tax=Quercus suber TaxID=58331 RepID=UPI0032DF4A7F